MKKIGLVGGMGPESTVAYYHDIVYGVKKATGRDVFPPLTIESVDLFKVVDLLSRCRYDEVADLLSAAVDNLARSGVEVAALTANTAHVVFDRVARRSTIPLVSIVEATVAEAVHRGYGRVGLLGTIFTMTGGFVRRPFEAAGIEVFTPPCGDATIVSDRIYRELEHGIVRGDTRREFVRIIADMQRRDSIESVVLGCTELPMLLDDAASPVPCLDTRAIHIECLINEIIS